MSDQMNNSDLTVSDINKQLDDVRKRREKTSARLEEKLAQRQAQREMERETNLAEGDEVFDRLVDEHPDEDIYRFNLPNGKLIALKLPTRQAVRTFRDSKMNLDNTDNFIRSCLLYPDKTTFDSYTRKYGMMTTGCSNSLLEIYGLKMEVAGN